MRKHNKRNRRRMHQGGFGDGLTVVGRVPRGLPQAPSLSPEAHFRLISIEQAARTIVRAASS